MIAGAKAPRALLVLAAAIALSYLAAPFVALPFPAEPLWKAAGVVLLAAYAFTRRAPIVGAALLFSAAGDAALALVPPVFVAGMGFFGAAHLFYAAAFATLLRKKGVNRHGPPLAALVIALSLAMLVWFLPDMGALRVPGLAYQAVITAMVALAALSEAPPAARVGAAVFMLSDSLIALGLYKDAPAPPGSIWISYIAAQILLAVGLSKAAKGSAA